MPSKQSTIAIIRSEHDAGELRAAASNLRMPHGERLDVVRMRAPLTDCYELRLTGLPPSDLNAGSIVIALEEAWRAGGIEAQVRVGPACVMSSREAGPAAAGPREAGVPGLPTLFR